MTRLIDAWRRLDPERRLSALAALALLVTMFFPWYGLQSLNRKTGQIYSHNIDAFGDVSFVEAAIFLVAAGVLAMQFARGEGRDFRLPGGDGAIVVLAGGWAALLVFFRVFSRPAGNGYPVGIEWGFFLAFVAAGGLAYSGWRMRNAERPEPPLRRPRSRHPRPAPAREREPAFEPDEHLTTATTPHRSPSPAPAPARGGRERYPPSPPEQLSFEDPPTRAD